MIYDHIVVHNGVWYAAGSEVPVAQPKPKKRPIANDSQGGQTAGDKVEFGVISDWVHEKIEDDSTDGKRLNIKEEMKQLSDFVHERKPNAKKKGTPNPYAGVYVSKTFIKRAKADVIREMGRKSKISNWNHMPLPKLRQILIETYSTKVPKYKQKKKQQDENTETTENVENVENVETTGSEEET